MRDSVLTLITVMCFVGAACAGEQATASGSCAETPAVANGGPTATPSVSASVDLPEHCVAVTNPGRYRYVTCVGLFPDRHSRTGSGIALPKVQEIPADTSRHTLHFSARSGRRRLTSMEFALWERQKPPSAKRSYLMKDRYDGPGPKTTITLVP